MDSFHGNSSVTAVVVNGRFAFYTLKIRQIL